MVVLAYNSLGRGIEMRVYYPYMFRAITLLSALGMINLVIVFTRRINDLSDLRSGCLFTMAIAIAMSWYFNLREYRRVAPVSDVVSYRQFAITIFVLGIFVNLSVQAGTTLLLPLFR